MTIEFTPEKSLKPATLKTTRIVYPNGEPVDMATATMFVIGAVLIAAGVVMSLPAPPPTPSRAPLAADEAPKPLHVRLVSLAPHEIGALSWADEPSQLLERTVRYRRTIYRHARPVAQILVPGPDGLWQQTDVQLGDPIPETDFWVVRIDEKMVFLRDANDELHRLFHPAHWNELARVYRFQTPNPIPVTLTRLSETPVWALQTGSRWIYGVTFVSSSGNRRVSDEVFRQFVPELERFAIEFQIRTNTNPRLSAAQELIGFLRRHRIHAVLALPDEPIDPSDTPNQ